MTDIPNEVNRHYHSHKHVEQTRKLRSTNLMIFGGNNDFQRSEGGGGGDVF